MFPHHFRTVVSIHKYFVMKKYMNTLFQLKSCLQNMKIICGSFTFILILYLPDLPDSSFTYDRRMNYIYIIAYVCVIVYLSFISNRKIILGPLELKKRFNFYVFFFSSAIKCFYLVAVRKNYRYVP